VRSDLLVVEGGLVLTPDLSAHKARYRGAGAPSSTSRWRRRPGRCAPDRRLGQGYHSRPCQRPCPRPRQSPKVSCGPLAAGAFPQRFAGAERNQTVHDKHLNGLLGAVEMSARAAPKPAISLPSFFGAELRGDHGRSAGLRGRGVRAVVAPMVADRTFYQAYPALLDENVRVT